MRTVVMLVCGAVMVLIQAFTCLGAEAGGEEGAARKKQIGQLQEFSARKAKQAAVLAGESKIRQEFKDYFAAGEKGDVRAVTNGMDKLRAFTEGEGHDPSVDSYWQTALEISLGYAAVVDAKPQHIELAVAELFKSIPERAIYFGGTDAGRGLATAFSTDHAAGKPFLTLTQNPLADRRYMEYLRAMYGAKMTIPDQEAVDKVLGEYMDDAAERLRTGKLKEGENVTVVDGRVSVQGKAAVMEINARIVKLIFDANKNREFFIEDSYPMDWTYPYLSPHRLVMKLNGKPLDKIGDEEIRKDYDYWAGHTRRFVGGWLTEKTGPAEVCAFVKKTRDKRDFSKFAGDRSFIESWWSTQYFGKWRAAMAGVYGWRAIEAREKNTAESARMQKAAEAAFAQAFAMGPRNQETVYGYANLVAFAGRFEEAILIAETALSLTPESEYLKSVVKALRGGEHK